MKNEQMNKNGSAAVGTIADEVALIMINTKAKR